MDSLLYKYRTISTPLHLRVITHSEVWFSAPSGFNDPFDCNIPIRAEDCPDEWWQDQVKAVVRRESPHLSVDDAEQVAALLWKERGPELVQGIRESQAEHFSDLAGVLSLTPHPKSKLMWSHYAASHTGFLVGFDQEVLTPWMRSVSGAEPGVENKGPSEGLEIRPAAVEYVDEMPRLLPCEMSPGEIIRRMVLNKAKDWAYEEEWRLIMMKFDDQNRPVSLAAADRAQQLPPGAIAEITLGARVSPGEVELITDLLRTRGDGIQLYQARLSDTAFDLTRKELSY